MPKTADNPVVDSAEIDFPSIPDKGTSAQENLAKDNLPPLEERYKKSSEEGVRLSKEAKVKDDKIVELETELGAVKATVDKRKDYDPFIDSLQTDPKLVEHITDYYRKPEGEDMRDMDMTDPKVVDQFVEKRAREIIRGELATYKNESAKTSQMDTAKQEFLRTHPDKSMKDVEDLITWSKSNPMTLDHVYMLKNPDEISKKVAETTRTDITEQMRTVSDTPASLATANSEGRPSSPVEQLHAAMEARINSANLDIVSTKSE